MTIGPVPVVYHIYKACTDAGMIIDGRTLLSTGDVPERNKCASNDCYCGRIYAFGSVSLDCSCLALDPLSPTERDCEDTCACPPLIAGSCGAIIA